MPHIVATVTDHGLGHLSISAPVLNRLYQELSEVKLTLISGLSEQRVRARISVPFAYVYSNLDFGMHNDNKLRVRTADTATAYSKLHQDWPERVQMYAAGLNRLNGDLVFSNASYLSLAAAKSLGLPSLALSPLNWADTYEYFCHGASDYDRIHDQMCAAYEAADVYLKPTPSMPMPGLSNTREVGPIAAVGSDRKHSLCKKLGINPSTKLALVAMGGHDITFPVTWPRHPSIFWLMTRRWGAHQSNIASLEQLHIPFLDLLASCDLLISKPGYGAFVEATCAGKPVLFVRRPDWPEEPYLIHWLQQQNRCRQLAPRDLQNGGFMEDILALLDSQPALVQPPAATGVDEVAASISSLLRGE